MGTHPAGVGARVSVADALVVMGGGEGPDPVPSLITMNETSGPTRHSSTSTRSAAAPNRR